MRLQMIKTFIQRTRDRLTRALSHSAVRLAPVSKEQLKRCFSYWVILLCEIADSPPAIDDPNLGRLTAAVGRDYRVWLGDCKRLRDALVHGAEISVKDIWWLHLLGYKCIKPFSLTPEQFRGLLCLATFGLKIPMPISNHMKEEGLRAYLACEERAAQSFRTAPPQTQALLDSLHDIAVKRYGSFTITSYKPRHGGGSVSDPKLKSERQKWDAMQYAPTVAALLEDLDLGTYDEYLPELSFTQGLCDYTSRLIFVPKTYDKPRTVKPEPVELQFFQQGVQKELYRFLERTSEVTDQRLLRSLEANNLLKPGLEALNWANEEWFDRPAYKQEGLSQHRYWHFPFQHQSQNQILALEGSRYNNFATLDLSAASDSVSSELVAFLFRDTQLGRWLTATRSKYVLLPDKSVIPTNIFAGMGSALCFPVESMVFGLICEHIVSPSGDVSLDWLEHRFVWSIYGDDIIVPREYAAEVIDALTELGFTVNRDKSFISGPFRESCGMEAYRGYDVTPLRYKVPHCSDESPDFVSSLVQLANRAKYVHGYADLRKAVLLDLQAACRKMRTPVAFKAYSSNPSLQDTSRPWADLDPGSKLNATLQHRYNENLQREEVKAFSIGSKASSYKRLDQRDELILYHSQLMVPRDAEVEMDPYTKLRQARTTFGCRWLPCD